MKKFLIAIISIFVLHTGYSQNPDIQLLKHINLNRQVSWDPTMRTLSNTTAGICFALPVALISYSYLKKDSLNYRKTMVIGASVVTASAISYVLKHVVNRQRPFERYPVIDQAISVNSSSFPSGHTSSSFSLATSLSLAYPKWYVIAPSYLWATSVAYSRLHLGVHYPSDILAGALIGAGSAYLSYKLNKVLGNKKIAQIIF